jgi:hypothetical protein
MSSVKTSTAGPGRIDHILASGRKRYLRMGPTGRPADVHDVFTCREAHALAVAGHWPLTPRQRDAVRGDRGREPRRAAQRLVRREIERAIPSVVVAVAEALRHGQ